MTLPASGIIKLSDIAAEFGYGNALSGYVGKTWYTDAGATGTFAATLKLSDFYGKRKTAPFFAFSVTSNVNQAVMSTLAYNAGWDGSLPLECTINSGVTVYSDDPTSVALWVNVPCTLINKGLILGGAGAGGKGGTIHGTTGNVPLVGGAGGAAIGGDAYISVDNQGVISGGGGGGGGGGSARYAAAGTYACGGGGGGAGAYGAPGAGGTGTLDSNDYRRDGSPGTVGLLYHTGGYGGTGGYAEIFLGEKFAGSGGSSGTYASAGASGGNPDSGSTWSSAGRAGGAGGAAVTNNAYITWINTGTRYGAIT